MEARRSGGLRRLEAVFMRPKKQNGHPQEAGRCCRGRQHVPDAIADHHCRSIGAPSRSAAARNKSGSGLALFDLIARHDWNPIRIDAERGQIAPAAFAIVPFDEDGVVTPFPSGIKAARIAVLPVF
jgi:hypothetical protein